MLCAAFEPLNSLIPSMIRFQLAPVCHASSVFVDHVDVPSARPASQQSKDAGARSQVQNDGAWLN